MWGKLTFALLLPVTPDFETKHAVSEPVGDLRVRARSPCCCPCTRVFLPLPLGWCCLFLPPFGWCCFPPPPCEIPVSVSLFISGRQGGESSTAQKEEEASQYHSEGARREAPRARRWKDHLPEEEGGESSANQKEDRRSPLFFTLLVITSVAPVVTRLNVN